MDGVTVTVRAGAGAFPEGATLSVVKVSAETAEAVDAAVGDAQPQAQSVLASYTFDISVVDAEGNELQPAEGCEVEVSFALAEAADEGVEASVYHIHEDDGDMTAEALDIVASSGGTVTALTDGFSLYNIRLAAANDAQLTITTSYVDGKGNYMGQVECLPAAETMADGWYVSQGNTFENRVEVSGEVNLILENGTVLQANDGIHVADGGMLIIWAQSTGSSRGSLIADYRDGNLSAAIGGNGTSTNYNEAVSVTYSGNITINGGTIIAYGSEDGAGIGDGAGHIYTGDITINGGSVTATGGRYGAGIGTGQKSVLAKDASIVITGGEVNAAGGVCAACIGGGYYGAFEGMLEISGGEVTARAESNANKKAAGIGGGWVGVFEAEATVRITGGKVIAESGYAGAGIGTGRSSTVYGTIEITGGEVTATATTNGANSGAGIGGGSNGLFRGNIFISGGTVTATGGAGGGAGIGAGLIENAREGHIHISGGTVIAKGGKGAAGIGGGKESNHLQYGGEGCGDVQITGGVVIAESGAGSCSAIGHGDNDDYYGKITFANGLMVHAGSDEADAAKYVPFTADARENACKYRHFARIEACDHPREPVENSELTTIPFSYISAEIHLRGQCAYCGQVFSSESHDFDDAGMCTICGYQQNGSRITFDANGGTGDMEDMFIAKGVALVMPECLFTAPEGKALPAGRSVRSCARRVRPSSSMAI